MKHHNHDNQVTPTSIEISKEGVFMDFAPLEQQQSIVTPVISIRASNPDSPVLQRQVDAMEKLNMIPKGAANDLRFEVDNPTPQVKANSVVQISTLADNGIVANQQSI